MVVDYGVKVRLRIFELPPAEGGSSQTKLKFRQEVVCRQKARKAISLCAVGLSKNHRGSPFRLKPFEIFGSFLNMDSDGYEIAVNEVFYFFLRVDLGIQPSASPSHRGGAEVKHRQFPLCFRVFQSLIGIVYPLNFRHDHSLLANSV